MHANCMNVHVIRGVILLPQIALTDYYDDAAPPSEGQVRP
jgi:hypothetical protein